jgi:hypothetical protein
MDKLILHGIALSLVRQQEKHHSITVSNEIKNKPVALLQIL